jgi:rubrerythrin
MKKSTIVIMLATATVVVALQSFTTKTSSKGEVKTESAIPTATNDAGAITFQNLQDAFKGESTASAKYEAYSKKAEEEGYHEIAMLFKAASVSEKIHANNHKSVLIGGSQKVPVITPEFVVKTTKENLKDAITGEGYEISTMYPEFLTNANTAKNQPALLSLNYAYKTEKKHKPFYEKALAALEANNVKSLPSVYFVCPVCGNTYDAAAPERCGISMTSGEKFIKVSNLNS